MGRLCRLRHKRFRVRLAPYAVRVMLLGAVFLGVFGVYRVCVAPYYLMLQCQQAQIDAHVLRSVVEAWRKDHPQDCPPPERLRNEGELSAASELTDPWDQPYVIRCDAASVVVRSAGRDGKLGSPDDIVVSDDGAPIR
jgi:hypothetical protein